MGQVSTPQEKELYRRVDEVLHYIWDPIGVAGCPQARDEYCSYLADVYSMLQQEGSGQRIAAYLHRVEIETMGLRGSKTRAEKAADILLQWKDKLISGA